MTRYDGLPEFVAARGQALLRTAFLLTGDGHLAEDLVQSALVKVAPRWRKVTAAGDPEAYVRRVLHNEHITWWRRRGRHGDHPSADPPEPDGAPDFAAGTLHTMVLRQALGRLTAKQRAVIVLRFYEDRSEAETARLLGCSVGTVKSQTHRALDRLRALEPGLAGLLADTETTEVTR
ncbi:SigE family RNA polymerase sigma factor [Actinomadura hibisca]|uniref:SigE family RNA polymerase sigma factor n=1 Tax=Actinomadura hibisca TaxID=68565 RepID=UPI0008331B79|nr:SigE family RNA polymerase sigma factor [Actinomadura hibisca]